MKHILFDDSRAGYPRALALAMVFAGALLSAGACSFDSGGTDEVDARVAVDAAEMVVDAEPGIDAVPTDRCQTWNYLPRNFNTCVIRDPQGELLLDRPDDPGNTYPYYLYDTTAGRLYDPDGANMPHQNQLLAQLPGIRLASLESLSIGPDTTLRVIGEHPLLLVSWEAMDIAGTIDASSTGAEAGGGANPEDCAPDSTGVAGQTNGDAIGEGSGGGGGGFGAMASDGGDTDSRVGGGGGQAVPKTPENLRGGCAGGRGGDGINSTSASDSGGLGGAGGGVVHLAVRTNLTIAGTARLHVGGAGGEPGDPDVGGPDNSRFVGGGGGGSGGWIGLEARSITIASGAILAANGGGGGSGANANPGTRGADGPLGSEPAAGGTGGDGANGGSGGALANRSGTAGAGQPTSGGGGGGSAGIVLFVSDDIMVDPGAIVSPTAIME